MDKQRQNALLGAAGGLVVDAAFAAATINTGSAFRKAFGHAGAMAFSVGFEREADYVGAYYAVRAGYDLTGAEEIWRALGQVSPSSIVFAKTHPTTPERFIQMRKVAAEIADKQRRHLPLVPELKVMQAQSEPEPERSRESNF